MSCEPLSASTQDSVMADHARDAAYFNRVVEVDPQFGTWRDIGTQLAFFCVVFTAYSSFVGAWSHYYDNQLRKARRADKTYWLQSLSAKILGTPGEVADKDVAYNQPALYRLLNLVQFCLSVLVVSFWISKSYTLDETSPIEKICGVAFCVYFFGETSVSSLSDAPRRVVLRAPD